MGALVIIIVGSLVIKYLKSDKGSIPAELLNQPNSVEMVQKTHVVSKGENLWYVAVKYYGDGFKWVDIATENKIANASVVEEGQELIIPDVKEDEIVTVEATDEITTESITATTYEVVKGDSLWKIAVRSYGDGYQWVKIASENNLVNPNIIHPGNILILPR